MALETNIVKELAIYSSCNLSLFSFTKDFLKADSLLSTVSGGFIKNINEIDKNPALTEFLLYKGTLIINKNNK